MRKIMSFGLSELLILLMPGFLSLWVYKRISVEDLDKRSEVTQTALALFFGLMALMSASLVDSFTCFKAITGLRISIESERGAFLSLFSGEFWLGYICLIVLSLLLGFCAGILQGYHCLPTDFLGRLGAWFLKRGPKEGCESSLRAVVNKLNMRENGNPLVRVYQIGENREQPLIGIWNGYSETEKEIDLIDLELCASDPTLNQKIENQARICWVNHESGIAVEFVASGREFNKGILKILEKKRAEKVAERAKARHRREVATEP
jgi:hypothetical protein